MRRLFSLMSEQVQGTGQQLRTWWDTLSPDPTTWAPFTWVLAVLVAVILLALLIRPRRRAARRPELLISHGELRVAAWAAPKVVSSLQAPHDVAYELAMTVSNLSASPVQLLELAVRTNAASAATAAEVTAVLPPHGAVDVTADLQEAGGDEGVLDLFVYVPDMPPKTFRVRAKLLWEPWNARYRVLPLDQRVDVARGFSERAQRRRQMVAMRQGRRDEPRERAASRWRGAAVAEEGRFEPRPEFARPRGERPAGGGVASAEPVRREPPADAEGSGFAAEQVMEETTWAARPERQQRHARVPGPGTAEHDAPAPAPGRQPAAASERGAAAGAAEPEAWRLGDADRSGPASVTTTGQTAAGRGATTDDSTERSVRQAPAPKAKPRPSAGSEVRKPAREQADVRGSGEGPGPGTARPASRQAGPGRPQVPAPGVEAPSAGEPAAGRTGLGRAARAGRGTEPAASEREIHAGTAAGAKRHGPAAESKRPRRWAIRSDAAARPADVEPGELVGPDELERDDVARARAGGEATGGGEAARGSKRGAGGSRARGARAASDERVEEGAGEGSEAEAPAREEPSGDEPSRPKLEFPDEF